VAARPDLALQSHRVRKRRSKTATAGSWRCVAWRASLERHRAVVGGRLIFDRQVDGRAKTGRAAIATVSPRTERLVEAYLSECGAECLPDPCYSGIALVANITRTHGDDFVTVRELTFSGDKRRLMDMRRSGVFEAIAGDVGPLGLSAKLANSVRSADV
jgi:hypothetical protein